MKSAAGLGAKTLHQRQETSGRALSLVLVVLGLGMAAASLVGPLGFGFMRYRTSDTTVNQLLGSDAAALFVVLPASVLAAVLVFRGYIAGRFLGSGVGVYAIYTYAQVVIGQEYLRLEGNVEYWFPLLLAVFILAEAAVVLSLAAFPADLPSPPPAVRKTAGVSLLVVAVFLVVGQHLRSLLIAWTNPTALTEYSSSPTPFWMVKLMDLGIIVPAAIASGVGLLLGAKWALKIMYPLLTGYAFLAASVASMAVVMYSRADPDASPAMLAAFLAFALLFSGLALLIYRPLFQGQQGLNPRRGRRGSNDLSP